MEVVTQRLDKRRTLGFAEEGMSCAQLVEAFAPPQLDREHVVVAICGVTVPREYWPHVTPKRHAHVIVAIVPGKGGGKKNPLALIASIAIAIVAPMAGAALAQATGATFTVFGFTAAQVFGAAIGFVANMALGALFKPSQPSFSAANGSTGSAAGSPTYSISGQSNVLDPYGPVRRIFGRHRVYPVVVGRPYTEVYGDDQYLTTLFDIGAGDYDISDVRIGASHVGYFQNAQYYVHRNTAAPNLQWYWGARHDEQYNLLMASGAYVNVDTVVDTGWFTIAFVFPTGLASIDQTTGNTQANTARFTVEWSVFGSGVWQPIEAAYWWTSSRNIVADTSSQVEITGGEVLREQYAGSSDDGGDLVSTRIVRLVSRTHGFPAGTTELPLRSLGATMLAGAQFNYNGTTYTALHNINTGIGSPAVPISPPLQTELVTQHTTYSGEEATEQYLTPPQVLAFYVGGGLYAITDQRIQQLALTITVRPTAALVEGARYSIRARQISGQGDEHFTYGDMALVGISSISATAPALNLRHAHTLLEMRVKANDQVSGTLEEVSCIAHSYLRVRRGGVWSYELSRNPAWALYEVLTGSMNKRPVAAGKIDVGSFEAWADRCDSTHPSTGAPRAMFDHVVDYYSTIFALAQTITASGRATLAPGDGMFRVLMDIPKTTPVQVFTPHNSIAFKGSRTFIEAPHAFRVKFMNEGTWKVEEMVVYNDGYSLANATVFEVIELPGVTREGQVWCDSRYRMAQGIHRQEAWTLDVDWENLICTRGDLVHVAHDVPKLGGAPARIRDIVYGPSGATQWTLTEPVDLGLTPSAFGYTIRAISGAVYQGTFSAQLDAYTVVPSAPVLGLSIGDLHVWGAVDHITYPFLVAAIAPQSDEAATLTLVPYAGAAIFGADVGTIPPYDPVVDDDLSNLAPPIIPLVTILQVIRYENRRPVLTVSFDWRNYVAPTFVLYEIWLDWDLNTPPGAPMLLARTSAPHFEWLSSLDLVAQRHYVGTNFCVRVLGVNAFGAKRTLAESPATCDVIIGDTTKPAAPPSFELDLKRDTITLQWEHPAEPDIDYYELRYSPVIDGTAFSQSTLLAPQVPYPQRTMDVPSRLGSYFIKAVDTSGNRSDEYASAFTPGENVWQLNVIDVWDDEPEDWPGSKTGFSFVDGLLQSTELAPGVYPRRSEYYYKDLYDGGAIYQTRFTSKIAAYAYVTSSLMASWIPLAIATPIGGSVVLDDGSSSSIAEMIDVYHELRWVTTAGVMADWIPLDIADPIGLGGSVLGAWRRFQVGDYIGQQFQFRLVAEYIGPDAVADVGVQIGDAWIEIDMTDRIDGRYDVACPGGGLHITYEPAFRARPVLSITQDNAAAGDRFEITSPDHTGFDIEFFNGASSVARQFDWLAKGYGAQSAVIIDTLTRKGTRRRAQRVITRRVAA